MAGLGVRLFTDEMIDTRVVVILRQQGYDAEGCHEAGHGNQGISDHEQLEYATLTGRAMLTFNRRHFRRLDRVWQAQGVRHAGIIVSGATVNLPELVRRVKLHLDIVRPEDQHNLVRLLAR